MLVLLKRLVINGGVAGDFIAQDAAVHCGAVWLCEFATKKSEEAAVLIGPAKAAKASAAAEDQGESELDRRKRLAREKVLAKMKAQAAKFATMMEIDDAGEGNDALSQSEIAFPATPVAASRAESVCSTYSSASSVRSNSFSEAGSASVPSAPALPSDAEHEFIPPRLLRLRPRCIICNDEEQVEVRAADVELGEGQRKKSRRRSENALGFVGYAQASTGTVLRGGGGAPPDSSSPFAPVSEFVGTHVALCGHEVHSECCESYLATVLHREDRPTGKRDEFRCPLCQRLSNCLVPFIDVGVDWVDIHSPPDRDDRPKRRDEPQAMQLETRYVQSLHGVLDTSPWWLARHNNGIFWDRQSAFVGLETEEIPESPGTTSNSRKVDRKGMVRSLKKKDLYAAWNAMMKTPRFVRRTTSSA